MTEDALNKQDFQDELAHDLVVTKAALLHIESSVESMLVAINKANRLLYSTESEAVYPDGNISLIQARVKLTLLLDKIEAINAQFNYGVLAQLIEDSGHDPIPF